MRTLFLIASALFYMGMPAFTQAEDTEASKVKIKTLIEKDANGNYHKTETRIHEKTATDGTTIRTRTNLVENRDPEGNRERNITREASTDPEGLMNKKKIATTTTIRQQDGKVHKMYKKTVNGKTVQENIVKRPD